MFMACTSVRITTEMTSKYLTKYEMLIFRFSTNQFQNHCNIHSIFSNYFSLCARNHFDNRKPYRYHFPRASTKMKHYEHLRQGPILNSTSHYQLNILVSFNFHAVLLTPIHLIYTLNNQQEYTAIHFLCTAEIVVVCKTIIQCWG